MDADKKDENNKEKSSKRTIYGAILICVVVIVAGLLGVVGHRELGYRPDINPGIPVANPSEFEEQLTRLVSGHLLVNAPEKMRVGEVRTVEIRISRDTAKDIENHLQPGGKVEVNEIKVGPFMGVRLQNPDKRLELTSLTREDQYVSDAGFTPWTYTAKAVESGDAKLFLSVVIRLKSSHGEERQFLPSFEKTITVKVDLAYQSWRFLKGNWRWLGTSIIIPIVGAPIIVWWIPMRSGTR